MTMEPIDGKVGATGFETSDLLLTKQGNTLTNYYILPYSRGKPGVVPEFPDIDAGVAATNSPPNSPRTDFLDWWNDTWPEFAITHPWRRLL